MNDTLKQARPEQPEDSKNVAFKDIDPAKAERWKTPFSKWSKADQDALQASCGADESIIKYHREDTQFAHPRAQDQR